MTNSELLQVAKNFRRGALGRGSPDGMCFAISAAIKGFLSATEGVQLELVEADFGHINHVWLELPDGNILDATADQFGLSKVYLGSLPDKYREWIGATSRRLPHEQASSAAQRDL